MAETHPGPPPRAASAFDLLPERQRHAAALLLSAVSLPAEMAKCAALWKESARVLPGATVQQLRVGDRLAALRDARELVDDLIREAEIVDG